MTTRGKIVLTVILLAVVGFGMYRWWDKIAPHSKSQNVSVDVAKVKEEIAKAKMPDLNAADLEAAMKIVAGSARSMGVEVEGL